MVLFTLKPTPKVDPHLPAEVSKYYDPTSRRDKVVAWLRWAGAWLAAGLLLVVLVWAFMWGFKRLSGNDSAVLSGGKTQQVSPDDIVKPFPAGKNPQPAK